MFSQFAKRKFTSLRSYSILREFINPVSASGRQVVAASSALFGLDQYEQLRLKY